MAEVVRLRGHHLLCLLGFRGLGYSPEFVENMTRIHAITLGPTLGRDFKSRPNIHTLGRDLKSHPNACPNVLIEIVAGVDDICAACPRLVEGRCGSGRRSRVARKDAAVLAMLSLRPGDTLASREIYRRVADALRAEDINTLCSQCQWLPLGLCADGLSRLESSVG